jgi:hypothetical protein
MATRLVGTALIIGLLTASAAFAGTAERSAVQRVLVVRIVSPPTSFFDSTPECPGGGSTVPLASVSGRPQGEASLCISEVIPTRRGFVEIGTMTLELAEGSIVAAVRIAFAFSADGSRALQLGAGTVVDGTGTYAGASGWIRGGGPIVLGPDGPEPNLTYVVRLGAS